MDYRNIKKLPVHLHLLMKKDCKPFGVNYEEVNMLHFLALMNHCGDVDWLETMIDVNCPDYKYLENVKLTSRAGSTELYLPPILVFLSKLPKICNRYNVQNYSSDSIEVTEDEALNQFYKTFRSVGLPPNKLYGRVIDQLNAHGIVTPGDKPLALVLKYFKIITKSIDLQSRDVDNPIHFNLSGFETERTLKFSPEQLYNFPATFHTTQMLIGNLYYLMYRSWFDEGQDVLTSEGRVYLNRHNLLATNTLPTDLTIHPSEFYVDIIAELALSEINREDNEKYPIDSKCELVELKDCGAFRQLIRGSDLIAEGKYMKHCIGGETYRSKLTTAKSLFFHIDVPGREHGATVSFNRFVPGSTSGKVYFTGEIGDLDFWVIDQFYGYRDESLKNDLIAIDQLETLIQIVMTELGEDVKREMMNKPNQVNVLLNKAHRPIERNIFRADIRARHTHDSLALCMTLSERYGFSSLECTSILNDFPEISHGFINEYISENIMSTNLILFRSHMQPIVARALAQSRRLVGAYNRGRPTGIGWGRGSGQLPQLANPRGESIDELFRDHVHLGTRLETLPTRTDAGANLDVYPIHPFIR